MPLEVDMEVSNVSDVQDYCVEAPKYVSPDVASARSNPNISPNDDEWLRIHRIFTQLLKMPGKSVDRILKDNFTHHDAVLFTPSESTETKALQELRSQRYEALLQGRFKGVERSLASKLTMMYFGRPVAPMTTALDKKDQILPIPIATGFEVPPTLSLRGGGASEDELSTIPDHSMFDDEERLTPNSNWVNLYGFRGCVPFVPTNFSSFARAAEKLLALAPLGHGSSRPFSLIQFDHSGTGRKIVVNDHTPFSRTSPCALQIRNHFSDKEDHENCCAFFIKLATEPDPVHLEPQPEQLRTDVARIGYPVFNKGEDPNQRVMNYAYLAFPEAKGAGAFDIEHFAANQYNPCLQTAIDTLIGTPPGRFHDVVFSLYDQNEPDGRFSVDCAAGSLGGSGVHTDVWNQLHPLNSPNARWMLKISHIPDNEIALVIHNYYRNRFPTLTQMDAGNVPSAIRRLVKQVWTAGSVNKMRSVQLRAGSASFGAPIRHPDVLEIEIDREHEGDQLRELDEGLNELISAPSNPWIVLSPVWQTTESNIYPSWVGAGARPIEFPPLGSSLSDFTVSVQVLCRMNPQRTYDPEKDSIFIKAVSDRDPEIPPVLDAPAFLIDPETTTTAWYLIRSYITSSDVEVTIFSTMEMDWNFGIPRSNVWGIKPAPPPLSKHPDPFVGLRYGNDGNLNRHNIQPCAPRVDLSRSSIRIWEDSTRQSDRVASVPNTAIDEPISDQVAPDEPGLQPPNQSENERAASCIRQPSIFDGPFPRIPINAPPAEHFLRTTSQVPMVSQAVMTPTEQARAESTVWHLRNLLLSRVWKCAHTDCNFSCQLTDAGSIHKHLEKSHGPVPKCMWCNTRLFEDWSEEQRMEHLRTKHMDKLVEATGRSEPRPLGTSFARGQQTEAGPSRQTPSPSRQNPPRTISYPLTHWYDFRGPQAYEDPCQECHLPGCPKPNLRSLDSRQIHQHFWAYHPEVDRVCPFCRLEFSTNDALEIIKHFDCHVYQLWDQARTSNAEPEADSSRALNTRAEIKKCPLFSACGAVIEYMTDDQVVQHLRNSHKTDLGIPQSPAPLQEEPPRATGSTARPPLAPIFGSPTPRNNRTPSDVQDGWSASNSMDSSPSILIRSQLKKRKRKEIELSDVEVSEGEASVSRAARATSPSARNKASEGPRTKKPKSNPIGRQGRDVEEDKPGPSRGRSRTSPNGTQQGHRQRSPSADWNDILGPVSPGFVPSEDMYCSKCLRKAPKLEDQSPGRSLMGRSAEMELHTAPDRCCRIRNGIGMAEDLPNRSGWIRAKDLRGQKLGAIKDGFRKKYPGYAQTLYPTKPADHNTSVWGSDPNNEDNKSWWDIPWPPFEGNPPFPGTWEHPGDPEIDTGRRRRDPKPARQPHDPLYRYRSDNDSDDGLEPDVDDTQEFKEAADTADVVESMGRTMRPKRKTPGVAVPGAGAVADDAQAVAGPSSKRPKKATGGAKKRGANALKPAKATRSNRLANKGKAPADPLDAGDEEDAPKPKTATKTTKRVKVESKSPRLPRARKGKAAAAPTRASTRSNVMRQRAEREAQRV